MTPESLKHWRTENKLSRLDLADKLHVSPKTIEAWEYGLNPIPNWLPLAMAAIDFISSNIARNKSG